MCIFYLFLFFAGLFLEVLGDIDDIDDVEDTTQA